MIRRSIGKAAYIIIIRLFMDGRNVGYQKARGRLYLTW